jgi:spermidine synthase
MIIHRSLTKCLKWIEWFSYQEMIAHLPLNSHPNPEHVLVIGGGDGGVLREVLKHPSVKTATLVDIDEAVPRVSKTFLPHMAAGFNDPRVTVHIGDGFQYLRDQVGKFDVIITDRYAVIFDALVDLIIIV